MHGYKWPINCTRTRAARVVGGFEHSVALGTDGEMYSFGCNNHGQLALGSKSNAYAPTRVRWPRPPHGPSVVR